MKFLFKLQIFVLCFFPVVLLGKDLPIDSSQVELKLIDESKIEQIKADKDFLYDRVPPPAETWWEALTRNFWEWFSEMFEDSKISSTWDYFKWVLLFAVVVFIVLKVFKISFRGIFQSKSETNKIHFIAEDEDINELNFETLIKEAINQKNYKEAIRLSFLQNLKLLTDKDLIIWKVDKTNADYLTELSEETISNQFKETSMLFEYAWYGDFKLDKSMFDEIIVEFNSLKSYILKQ